MTGINPKTCEAVLQIAAWQVGILESPAGSNKVKFDTSNGESRGILGSLTAACTVRGLTGSL